MKEQTNSGHAQKRYLTPAEERGLNDVQKAYLVAHPHMASLQPHTMLPPREQLYQSMRHGAVTIDRAIELDSLRERNASRDVPEKFVGPAFDNYSAEEDRFIDRNGMSSGLF